MPIDLPKFALLMALCVQAPFAGEYAIVLDFTGPHSDRSISEMKREFEGILKNSGNTFSWLTRSEVANQEFANLVVVRFKGKCVLEPIGYLYDERGPLAFTRSTDGNLQPFSEVECDQVTTAVRGAMFGGDYARADLLLGRALGRVLAHEFIHFQRNSKQHDRAGIEKESLSPVELIAPHPPHK